MQSFFATRMWPEGVTRLHVYVLPDASRDEQLLNLVTDAQQVLRGITCVRAVDLRWMHLTIQMIDTPALEVTTNQRHDLIDALQDALEGLPTIQLPIGGIMATRSAVIANIGGDEEDGPWWALRDRVRSAIGRVLGAHVMTYDSSVPHSTVAYGTYHGDSGAISSQLLHAVRPPFATLTIDRVHLVDVTQDADAGTYTWASIATVPFGRSAAVPGVSPKG